MSGRGAAASRVDELWLPRPAPLHVCLCPRRARSVCDACADLGQALALTFFTPIPPGHRLGRHAHSRLLLPPSQVRCRGCPPGHGVGRGSSRGHRRAPQRFEATILPSTPQAPQVQLTRPSLPLSSVQMSPRLWKRCGSPQRTLPIAESSPQLRPDAHTLARRSWLRSRSRARQRARRSGFSRSPSMARCARHLSVTAAAACRRQALTPRPRASPAGDALCRLPRRRPCG